MKLSVIAEFLNAPIIGEDVEIEGVSEFDNYKENTLTFMYNDVVKLLNQNMIVLAPELEEVYGECKSFIPVDNPRLAMAKVIKQFYHYQMQKFPIRDGINNSKFDNATVYSCCETGRDVYVGENSVIGKDNYGFVKDENNKPIRFPNIGGVIIGNNVDIGACVCIDRGTFGNTVIGNGVKIDNLCSISHDVKIGDNSLIMSSAILLGHCEIGEGTRIAPGAIIRNRIKVGSNCMVGMGSVVTKDIPDNITVMGVPAKRQETK